MNNDDVVDQLIKNFLMTLDQLSETAEKESGKKSTITASIMELKIDNVQYQVQISYVPDKKTWVDEDAIRFHDVTKITSDFN